MPLSATEIQRLSACIETDVLQRQMGAMAKAARSQKSNTQKSALVLINSRAGSVRTRGAETVLALVKDAMKDVFSPLEVRLVEGDLAPHLEQAKPFDTVIAGGGDGTISAVAAALVDTDKILGVLPLGTMNMFSRTLGFPQKLEAALADYKQAKPIVIDVGSINDRLFLRQVSFGLQPRMVRLRERMGYRSRLTKMWMGIRAFSVLAANPRAVRVMMDVDDHRRQVKAPLLIVSNNQLGKDMNFALQASLRDGELGIYTLHDASLWTLLGLARDHVMSRLSANAALDMETAKSVELHALLRKFRTSKPTSILCSIDGETCVLPYPVGIRLQPRSLRVWSMKV